MCRIRRQPFRYYIVVDYEATCEEKDPNYFNEIIEFPLVLLSVDQRNQRMSLVDTLRIFVRPTINPKLTDFCVKLTGITQQQVDSGVTLSEAFIIVHKWLQSHNLVNCEFEEMISDDIYCTNEKNIVALQKLPFAFITDGPYDFYNFLHRECQEKNIRKPIYYSRWINIRRSFYDFYDVKAVSLIKMLNHLNMCFQGNHHSGLDDSLNIAKIAMKIVEDGGRLDINDHLIDYIQELKPQPFSVLVIVDVKTSPFPNFVNTAGIACDIVNRISAIAINTSTLEKHGDDFEVSIASSSSGTDIQNESESLTDSVGNALKLFSKWMRKNHLIKSRYPSRSKSISSTTLSSAIVFCDSRIHGVLKQNCAKENILFPKYLNKWVNLSYHVKDHMQRHNMNEIDLPLKKGMTNLEVYMLTTIEILRNGAVLYSVNNIPNKSK